MYLWEKEKKKTHQYTYPETTRILNQGKLFMLYDIYHVSLERVLLLSQRNSQVSFIG